MRAFALCLGIGILLTAACGGGSSSTTNTNTSISTGTGTSNGRNPVTGQCTASTAAQTCTGEAAYEQCLMTACGSQLAAAFGAGYASGSFTGPCAPYITCENACPCDATASTCDTSCLTSVASNTACLSAFQAVGLCVQQSSCAAPVCTSNTTDTGASTATYTNVSTATYTSVTTATGGCAAALQCCNTLTLAALTAAVGGAAAQVQQECATVANAGVAASCNQLLVTLQAYGFCK